LAHAGAGEIVFEGSHGVGTEQGVVGGVGEGIVVLNDDGLFSRALLDSGLVVPFVVKGHASSL
jgi:hypothetical protein